MDAAVSGVHHVKIWVKDLARSHAWYEQVFRLRLRTRFEDGDGVVRGMAFDLPGTDVQLALREDPVLATALSGADPFALQTTREGLDAWTAHLDALGIPHSPVIRASAGHAMGFPDPDGLQIRLYAPDDEIPAAQTGPERVYRPGPLPGFARG
ncbi:catechol 2,3-dioxygenase-like lactoylglutathione lyase family enzyme [Streptosporangium album]|uniref:Catechol 2,3-dioxygenase-like lactoylglutathione lyase family enzyme n=2 Tax=Streptosporangium album TaxID=47479 RepID=A0A7W7WDB5_9ACTN|nr:VOC family protein [Streptosporangium album]MBB4942628.1 catechol 2,3-dioxygenase-like lactoylglutathione lyase family enzyme [Streptosporangium album]